MKYVLFFLVFQLALVFSLAKFLKSSTKKAENTASMKSDEV